MVKTVGIAKARSNISEILGEIRFKRELFKLERKGKPIAIIQDIDTFKHLISKFKMHSKLKPDDGYFMAYCPELDLVATQETKEEAIEDLVEAAKDYAQRYMREFDLYAHSPNRSHHLPYVIAILSGESDEEVKKLLGL